MLAAPTPSSVWRNPSFVLLWSGQFVSALGTKISGLALPLLVLALTNSPAQAGFLASARMVPYLVFGLPAGALVDRLNRKTVLIVCDLVRFAALCSVPVAWKLGVLTVAQLYAVALIQGTAFVFFNVAEYAVLTEIIDQEQLASATALDSTAWSTASLIGPGVAGSVIGLAKSPTAGAVLGFFADGLTFLVSVISLAFLRVPPRPMEETQKLDLAADIKSGLGFVAKHPALKTLALSATFLSFIFAPVSLGMIVLAKGTMHATPATIGLVFSTAAFGGIVGSLIAPRIARRWSVGQVMVGAVAVQSLATVAVGLANSPFTLAMGWTVAFLLDPVLNTSAAAFRLRDTPSNLQARVQSIFRLGSYGGEPLGSAFGGLIIAAFGARTEILGVAAAVGIWSFALWRSPLRRASAILNPQ